MWYEIERLLSGRFMPHGHCYLWAPAMVWLQVTSNLLIALAYLSISSTLYYIIRRIRDLPFSWMYLAFGIFIITCGGTHFLDVVTVWHPVYWLDGGLRGVTAVASVGTALLLFPLIPKALALANAAQLAHERGQKLEATYKELEVAHMRTKEVERMKTDFFANVSHELRTPLALVLGPAEKLLDARNLAREQRDDLERIVRNARVVLKHVNDLLDVAKLDAGRMKPAYARVDVSSMTRLTLGLFTTAARDRRITLESDVDSGIVAEIDPEKVERILLNVLGNALKFTPDGGIIRCTLRRVEAERAQVVRFEIADSGPGIPADMRETVFERFAQLETGTTRKFGGTGLGLAIAHDFAVLHGGRIGIDDAPEGGARFLIELPVQAPPGAPVGEASGSSAFALPLATPAARAAAKLEEGAPEPSSSNERGLVLVVEDNQEMNAFISETLASDHAVVRAFDGAEGLTKARTLRPDLVVTDLMMPKMSGDALVRALQAESSLARIPVLVLSAKADDDLRIRLLAEGVADYVMKPFAREEIRSRVRNLVRTKRAVDILQSDLSSREADVVRLAEEARRRKRTLEDTVEMAQVAREQAERASQAKSAFLAMVSHELRTPLSSMRLGIDQLKAKEWDSKIQRTVGRLDGGVVRLTDLVDALLEHARIQSGALRTDPETVDMSALVAELVEELRPQADAKNLSIDTELPGAATLVIDRRLTRIVISNLLANAVKFTTHGGVRVGLELRGEHAVVRVTDTGPGIDHVDQTRIFEPFEQLEPTRKKHIPGVGLGLALVYNIVMTLGGTIRVDSELGQGSTFEVQFERTPRASPARAFP